MVQGASNIYITDSDFEENSAVNGGAIYLNDCYAANISFNQLNYNAAQQQGGAIFQVRLAL